MHKIFYTVIFSFLFTSLIHGQTYNIKGKIVDDSKRALPSATVLLLNAKDSVMLNYALSNNAGKFEIKNVSRGDIFLRFSYMGYVTLSIKPEFPDGDLLDLGVVELTEETKFLEEFVIEQERIPMRVRNDTIEYDALAFKPLPNETVEDMLKRMPGITVESDGRVVAQGEQVRRVLVNGKEFFGRDPQMATQNIPADAVSKVHVFDERSERAQFTGIDDGQRERTMNLELKEDRKEAAFGNSSLGYGPDNRFEGRTNLNRFDGKGQVSLLAMGNNLNQQGFSIADYMNFSGGTQNLMSGRGGFSFGSGGSNPIPVNYDGLPSSNGLMTSWAGGLNFNRQITPGTEITASYFYNQLSHDMTQELERENYLPEGSYDYNQNQTLDNQNFNHRLSLRIEHEYSESGSLLFTSSGSFNKAQSDQNTFSQTYNINGGLQNEGEQLAESERQNMNIDASLLLRQRLSKPGRTITAGLDYRSGLNNQHSFLNAINYFYHNQDVVDESIIQDQDRADNSNTISTSLNYTEPLGNGFFLEGNYDLSYSDSEVNFEVFDLDSPESEGVFNPGLSNHYINRYTYHRGGVNMMLNREDYNLTLGAAAQASELRGTIKTFDHPINEDYFNVLPAVRFNYSFTTFRRLMVNYQTSVREPDAVQIQPITDNRDPLNVYKGNPELEPSYSHNLQLRFNSFNPQTSFGYFAFLSGGYTKDAITNSVDIDGFMVRTTQPVNVESTMNLRGSFHVNLNLSRLKSRVMVGASLNRMQSVNVLNQVEQDIVNNTLGGNFRYMFRPLDEFELRLSANLSHQLTQYEFSADEVAFLNQTYRADGSWTFLEHYRLQAGYRYLIYEGRSEGFDRQIPLLDINLSRSFRNNNSGELKLSVFNLLDQDLGVTQTHSTNYYESAVTNSLGRYFLLTFTYSLNRQLNVMDSGPGGGMRMMRMH